jgi:hypothetical protein
MLGYYGEEVSFETVAPPPGIYKICVSNKNQVGGADQYRLIVLENDIDTVETTDTVLGGQQKCLDYRFPICDQIKACNCQVVFPWTAHPFLPTVEECILRYKF